MNNNLPLVKRARGCYLYSPQGQRYLDLFRCNGTATMGHRPTNFTLALKNPLEQGLTMAYPNLWHNRLMVTLSKCYPAYHIYLYDKEEETAIDLKRRAVEPWQEGDVSYLRPMFDLAEMETHIYLPSIPLDFVTIILSKKELPQPKQPLPAFIARALLRFVDRREVDYDHTLEPLFDQSPLWTRHGCYIVSALKNEEEYSQLFNNALQASIVLPPSLKGVGLLPPMLSKGERGRLACTLGV